MAPLARLLAAAGLAAALACGQTAAAQTTLRYSNWLPVGHPLRAQAMDPWAQEVEKATQGRVRVEALPKVLVTVPGQYDAVRDGLADVALFVPSYTPGKFEITEMMELPFLADKASVRSPASWRFYQKHLAAYDEYKGVRVLSLFTGPALHVYTAKRAIRSIGDFAGLKLRSPNPAVSQGLTLLGATPVLKPATEIYELVSGGVLDGAATTISDVASFRLTGLLPRAQVVGGGFTATVIVLAINPAKWAALSKADQDAVLAASGEKLARAVGAAFDAAEADSLDATRKAGGSVDLLPPALVDAMKERTAPLEKSVLDKARKHGVKDPAELLGALKAEVAAGR